MIAIFIVCMVLGSTSLYAGEKEAVKEGAGKGKKVTVSKKVLMDMQRQVRLMREEMAELEEKIERMTTKSDQGR